MVVITAYGPLFDVRASTAVLRVQRAGRGRREEICELPFSFLLGPTFHHEDSIGGVID